MKKSLVLLLFTFILANCYGQSNITDTSALQKTVKEQAEKMAQLLLKKDFKSFSGYTHPEVVKMLGGEKKMIKVLNTGIKEIESQGIHFVSVDIGTASKIISVNGELQCTIPQILTMTTPDGKSMVVRSTLIAVSFDEGKNWVFLDTSTNSMDKIREAIPGLSKELVIPPKPPVTKAGQSLEHE